MNNYVNDGTVVTAVAPRNVSSGEGTLIGAAMFGVATGTFLSTATGEFVVKGRALLTAKTSQAWTQGDRLFWDNTNFWVSKTSTDGIFIGLAAADKGSSAAVGDVNLGVGPELAAAGTVVSLTDSSTGVSGGNTVPAVTNPDLSGWTGSADPTSTQATAINAAITALKNDVATLAAKVNAILAAF
jgi:predicted RecA/RadA family phage recombinase